MTVRPREVPADTGLHGGGWRQATPTKLRQAFQDSCKSFEGSVARAGRWPGTSVRFKQWHRLRIHPICAWRQGDMAVVTSGAGVKMRWDTGPSGHAEKATHLRSLHDGTRGTDLLPTQILFHGGPGLGAEQVSWLIAAGCSRPSSLCSRRTGGPSMALVRVWTGDRRLQGLRRVSRALGLGHTALLPGDQIGREGDDTGGRIPPGQIRLGDIRLEGRLAAATPDTQRRPLGVGGERWICPQISSKPDGLLELLIVGSVCWASASVCFPGRTPGRRPP